MRLPTVIYPCQLDICDVPMHKEAVGMLDVDESLVVVAIEAFEIWKNDVLWRYISPLLG